MVKNKEFNLKEMKNATNLDAYKQLNARLEQESKEQVVLTRGNKKIIAQAIESLPEDKKMNLFSISEKVAEIVCERFGEEDSRSEYQIKRTGLSTSKEIKNKVMLFLQQNCVPINGHKEVSNLM